MVPGFRDADTARALGETMARTAGALSRPVKIMEVCGTHTVEIARHGLKAFLPKDVSLVSGPGCPVCVTPDAYVDAAVAAALEKRAGDMLRVPGREMSLEEARARGGDIRVVYSPTEALRSAREDPDREWVFLGIGFETTTPLVAATVEQARRGGVGNFTVLTAPKTVPPALHALIDDPNAKVDGFLCPGHVSVIIGPQAYEDVASRGTPCVVAGFEPIDILQSITKLLVQMAERRAVVENQYFRAVRPEGNPLARDMVEQVFEVCDARWRGIGVIPQSGLGLREEYAVHDAALRFDLSTDGPDAQRGCVCGDVLKGITEPLQCPLFANTCMPEHPVGPCMVSSEGSCAAAFKYGRIEDLP